ncbi:unnamed protein product, partial [Rotaria sp. Silwood1]
MTIHQAVPLYSIQTKGKGDNESETDTDESIFSSSTIWTRIHTINYRQATNSLSTINTSNITTISSSNRIRRTINTQNLTKKTIKNSKRSSIISTIDELWLNGQCKKSKSLLISILDESLLSILTINDLSLN